MEIRSSIRKETSALVGTWDLVAEQLNDALAGRRPESELRAHVRQWCAEARRRRLAPEQFLVVLKSQFARVPALHSRRDDGSRPDDVIDHIVRMCIEEYFATPADRGVPTIAEDH
jgi:hypothetical protein